MAKTHKILSRLADRLIIILVVAWLWIYAGIIQLSLKYMIFSNSIRVSSGMLFLKRVAKTAACKDQDKELLIPRVTPLFI